MRTLLLLALFVGVAGATHASTCYLSETGKLYYQAMDVGFCKGETCVTYTKLNGSEGEEVMKFYACAGRHCMYRSQNYTLLFPAGGAGSEYVSNIEGTEVYLICPVH